MSTGMGCPSTAIGVEELANIGVKTMVRLGTSGAMQEHTRVGDLVIANGAVRQEGTSTEYMPI
jgi:uridine phosphorylase